jgi:hypothetical protein
VVRTPVPLTGADRRRVELFLRLVAGMHDRIDAVRGCLETLWAAVGKV